VPDDPLEIEINAGLQGLFISLNTSLEAEMQLFAATLQKEVAVMRARGMADEAIYQVLLQDAREGGRIFTQFSTSIKSQMYRGISDAGQVGSHAFYRSEGIDIQRMQWINVTGPAGNCPDCESREGRIEDAETWEMIGTPRSGWSVCRGNCDCLLEVVVSGMPTRVTMEAQATA